MNQLVLKIKFQWTVAGSKSGFSSLLSARGGEGRSEALQRGVGLERLDS